MEDFFHDVDLVKDDIGFIRNSIQKITEINQEQIYSTGTLKNENDLQQVIDMTNQKASHAKNILKKMKEDTDTLIIEEKIKQSEKRIRENLCNTLTRKFIEIMKDYQNSQQKYKTDIKKKVERQVQIVKPDAKPSEIETVLASKEGVEGLYKEVILTGQSEAMLSAYQNVADKYKDVLTLEASVTELHQMFLDFALLTEQQGELLDQIEFQVKSAVDYIDDANTDITKSIKYTKSLRKKQVCCVIIIIIIIIVILAVAGVFKQKN